MNTEKAVARLTEVIRRKHLALDTERSYCAWLRRYCDNLKKLTAHLSSEQKLERFLNALAQHDVTASIQNQAFNATGFNPPDSPFAFPYRHQSCSIAGQARCQPANAFVLVKHAQPAKNYCAKPRASPH